MGWQSYYEYISVSGFARIFLISPGGIYFIYEVFFMTWCSPRVKKNLDGYGCSVIKFRI